MKIHWTTEQCPECGEEVYVETTCGQNGPRAPYAYDGDIWRCEDGHTGKVYVDDSAEEPTAHLGDADEVDA